MGKDKRGFGERSTKEAPIAPKLHKRLDRCRAAYEASIFKGERKGGMCELPKASDRLGSDRSPHFKLAHTRRKLLRVLLLVLDQCLY